MIRHRNVVSLTFIIVLAARSAVAAVTIPTVPVGNPGNPADSTGFGAVSQSYQIGKYEVTNDQYDAFLTAVAATDTYGLYNPFMASEAQGGIVRSGSSGSYSYAVKSGQGNMPVVFVSFWDAARFANWLSNGQPTGSQNATTTEDGAYTLNGYNGSNGASIIRNPGATWFIPTEDEWYKAAYHKNNGVTSDYWQYPSKSNVRPSSDQPLGTDAPDASNTANIYRDDGLPNGFDDGYAVSGSTSSNIHTTLLLTPAGAYSSASGPYGTFDQGGNAWEWTETVSQSFYRDMRGGSYSDGLSDYLISSQNSASLPSDENNSAFGFRIARLAVPEPNIVAMLLIGLGFPCRIRRK